MPIPIIIAAATKVAVPLAKKIASKAQVAKINIANNKKSPVSQAKPVLTTKPVKLLVRKINLKQAIKLPQKIIKTASQAKSSPPAPKQNSMDGGTFAPNIKPKSPPIKKNIEKPSDTLGALTTIKVQTVKKVVQTVATPTTIKSQSPQTQR